MSDRRGPQMLDRRGPQPPAENGHGTNWPPYVDYQPGQADLDPDWQELFGDPPATTGTVHVPDPRDMNDVVADVAHGLDVDFQVVRPFFPRDDGPAPGRYSTNAEQYILPRYEFLLEFYLRFQGLLRLQAEEQREETGRRVGGEHGRRRRPAKRAPYIPPRPVNMNRRYFDDDPGPSGSGMAAAF